MDAQRLERFVAEQLSSWEVPGCAVGVVHGDRVALAGGFGTRRLGEDLPVSTSTIFAIGSTTKAFTAAAIGALVDDGTLTWDTRVRDAVPGFAMHDPVATDRITVLDLLSHRSGLPRHEFVWVGHPERTRADLVRRLRHLPLSKDIREAFQYSNLGYIAIGHLIEAVTGSTWEEFVSARLLKPLGMTRTSFTLDDLRRTDDHAFPHERRGGAVVEIPFRALDHVGPAGSLNSCVDDMVSWLTAQLNPDVLSAASLDTMHAPHITLPEDRTFPEATHAGYGLGWLVGQYRGHRMVDHTGGVDGFFTDMILLPDDRIGVVVMTDRWSPLGTCIGYRAIDELLELEPIDWASRSREQLQRVTAARDAKAAAPHVEGALLRPLADYAGEYEHPGYGTFVIEVAGNALVPRFGALAFSMSHRHFDVFDLAWDELVDQDIRFPLTFLTAPDGTVAAFEVPFEDGVPPIRFERRRSAETTNAADGLVEKHQDAAAGSE